MALFPDHVIQLRFFVMIFAGDGIKPKLDVRFTEDIAVIPSSSNVDT